MTHWITPLGVVPGQLSDASISGVFIATHLTLPPMARVNVEVQCGNGRTRIIPAFAVRSDSRGIAVEWRELAPAAILATTTQALGQDNEAQARAPAPAQRPCYRNLLARPVPIKPVVIRPPTADLIHL
jgi:hypothetical protein